MRKPSGGTGRGKEPKPATAHPKIVMAHPEGEPKTKPKAPEPGGGDKPFPHFTVPRGYKGRPTQPGQRVLGVRVPKDGSDGEV